MVQITDQDIERVERALLPEGDLFGEEARAIIKSLETKDVKACPGSGKTTTLIAKLMILANKFPLDRNQGICVLTHTNVAIDEINQRMGLKYRKLFSYPNNFSTIQTFINQYLAIPAYNHYFNKNVVSIDRDAYRQEFVKEHRNLYPRPGSDNFLVRRRLPIETLSESLLFDFNNLGKVLNGEDQFDFREATETYRNLLTIKRNILDKGILSFHDAYVLANKYLLEYPEIKEIFSSRFAFVFVDEMQDTDSIQLGMIERLFNDDVVVQRIGDENQAIFHANGNAPWIPKEDFLSMSSSQRFSVVIADRVKNVSPNPQEDLGGNPIIPHMSPLILKFSEESIGKVLPCFGQQIYINGLHAIDKKVFKAVGRVGKRHEQGKITIGSYYEAYSKDHPKKRTSPKTLKGYLQILSSISNNDANEFRAVLLAAIVRVLRISAVMNGQRYYTEKTFITYLRQNRIDAYQQLITNLSNWILECSNGEDIEGELKEYIKNDLMNLFGVEALSGPLIRFLEEEQPPITPVIHDVKKLNIFVYNNDEQQIEISLDTVHNVKGETHNATLYLETFNRHYDFDRIIEFVKGNRPKRLLNQPTTIANLRLAYVGLTRASHLLGIAVRKEALEGHEETLVSLGWQVVDVDEFKE